MDDALLVIIDDPCFSVKEYFECWVLISIVVNECVGSLVLEVSLV